MLANCKKGFVEKWILFFLKKICIWYIMTIQYIFIIYHILNYKEDVRMEISVKEKEQMLSILFLNTILSRTEIQ